MSSRFDLIAQQILQKNFAACSLDDLQQFAAANPQVAAAHFLVAKKLHELQDPAYRTLAQKPALYYHMPVAFEAFLLAESPAFPDGLPKAPEERSIEAKMTSESETETVTVSSDGAEPETVFETQPIVLPALPALDEPVAEDALTFEPFHTVDYFASQGIRLSQEELPNDKFGKQLMSFTAWLKTMKKLPAGQQGQTMDPQAEQKVEHMAAHSVSNAEVVTETMAEIWLRQGQREKAADLYRKLSLLHPSKKAYFAAKLENLKP